MTKELSPTMIDALVKLLKDGVIYMGNGVSLATVKALESRGLATVETKRVSETNYRSQRVHYSTDWAAWPTRTALADARKEQEEEEETTSHDCFAQSDVYDGYAVPCARCADQADAGQATDAASEESADQVINPGDTVEVAGTLVTVDRRLYLGERLIIICRYEDSNGFGKYGVADFGSVSMPSIVTWGVTKQAAEVTFVEWTETVRKMTVNPAESETEKFSVDMLAVVTVSVPATDADSARARVAELFDNGAEFEYVTGTDSYGQEFKDVRLTAISGRGVPAVVDNDESVRDPEYMNLLTDSTRRELSELVDAYRHAADGPSAMAEHDAANALADAVAALLGR